MIKAGTIMYEAFEMKLFRTQKPVVYYIPSGSPLAQGLDYKRLDGNCSVLKSPRKGSGKRHHLDSSTIIATYP